MPAKAMKNFFIPLLVAFIAATGFARDKAVDKVICPDCQKLGLKSTVNFTGVGTKTKTVTWIPITYDENGTPTYHKDPNPTSWLYYCSNGHTFVIIK